MEWKLVKDDLHRLRQELAERFTRLSKLRAKHETLLAKHGQSAEEQDKSEVQHSPARPALRWITLMALPQPASQPAASQLAVLWW